MRSFTTAVACVALLVMTTTAFAAAPRFRTTLPLGGQRGTEVEVVFVGERLHDAEEILLYDKGMEVVSFELISDEALKKQNRFVKVKFKIAPDCTLGAQRMRVRTKTGLSDLQNFHVGALPVINEVEPNTEFDKAQVINMNVTVSGRIDREDVDYFRISAKKGDRISAEVFGMRLGRSTGPSYFDPYVAILNKDRFELATNDDTALLYNDAMVSVIAPEDGDYTVMIRDASYNGDGNANYLLQVGSFPRPLAIFPAGGKPGEKTSLSFIGDVRGAITREVTLPTEIPENFTVEVSDDQGVAPTPHPFRLNNLSNFNEQEPNNSIATANAGTLPAAFNGIISEKNDVDCFKFTAKKDQTVQIEVYARRLRSGLDPLISVHQLPDGKQLASDDDSRGVDCAAKVKIPVDGEYAIVIRDHLRRGDPSFFYRIEVEDVQPKLNVSPIEFARYIQHQLVIPQGGGAGFVANVQRLDMAGPVNFRSDLLPPGVRMECPESWRNDGTASVVLYADEDAPLSGGFFPLKAYLDDPKQPDRVVEGNVFQNVLMIRANNNDRVWEERMDRLPIIVVEKPKFKCWIETPAVPIVQNGNMNLVVKCERAEGFDAEIRLLVLQNAPGITSNGSAKIAKGETEGIIAINAADKAAVRETMIAVRCISTHGDGEYESVTPFVPLRVEPRYVTFEFAQGAVEQGKEIPYIVKVTHQKEFAGEAKVELLGLPAHSSVEPIMMTKDTEELVFTFKAAANTPVGMSQSVLCRVEVPENGTFITHNLGTGRLRVDKPAPPPKENPDKPAPAPAVVAQTAAPPKPLSRLEQLRQQQKERDSGGE